MKHDNDNMVQSEKARVWISRNALSEGIFEIDAKIIHTYVLYRKSNNVHEESAYGEGYEWHRTKKDAIAAAERMRQKKIQATEKLLQRLKELKF